MSYAKFRAERILHAYVDGELSKSEKQRMLVRLESDERSRRRVGDLQRTKEWVQFSFEDEGAPLRTLTRGRPGSRISGIIRVAASVTLVALAFGAGWLGRTLYPSADVQLARNDTTRQAHHVVLHIGEADDARFGELLEKAENILDTYSFRGVQVEVVTNAGGLDLLRTTSSNHVERIKQLIDRYENVRFIACSKGLQRLRREGRDVQLIQGVYSNDPAADHLIQRLTQGWTLISL